jgi:hypothetical protein
MPLELGFQANAGPLSQISVQLISPETAFYLAVGLYGWLTTPKHADSLNKILEAGMARLAPISTFNMQSYTIMRKKHPLFGVARQSRGTLKSVELPVASSSEYGSTGLCCLYALSTALLCFFDQDAAVSIIMEILPEYLLHYEQEGVRWSKDPGPLYTAIRSFVESVAKEEVNSKAMQTLLRTIDDLRLGLGPVSPASCSIPKNSDSRAVCAFLEWLCVPYSKRRRHLYPTRSFLVWALAEVLSCLGFEMHVSKIAVQTAEQYSAIFDKAAHVHEMGVFFVPVNVGKTDPYINASTCLTEIPTVLAVRIIPIRAIPLVELGQYLSHDSVLMETLSEAWNYTFQHIQSQSRDKWGADLTQHQKCSLEAYNVPDLEWGRVSLVHQSLKLPVSKFIKPVCPDCLTQRRDSLGEDPTLRTCWLDSGHTHNQEGKLALRIIYMAAAYSLACGYVEDDEGPVNLDTDVGYEPSRASSVSEFLSLETTWHNWFMNHYHMVQPYSCDSNELFLNLAHAMCGSPVPLYGISNLTECHGSPLPPQGTSNLTECYGYHANGLTLLSKFLLDPVASHSVHSFSLRFGQPIDLPIQGNLVISRDKPTHLKGFSIKLPPLQPLSDFNTPFTDMVRWDVEPDWKVSELDIHYQCRTQGIANLSIPLPVMKTSLKNIRSSIREYECQAHEEHQGVISDCERQQLLAEYEADLSCHLVPYRSIRQQGYSRILLEPRKGFSQLNKPTVVILETFSDPVEQWLALNTECQATSDTPFPMVRRIISPCFRCGLLAASKVNRAILDTVVILVITS